ncbi:unnamed protein product [Dracunculus medinensis]|uniref:Uncharacterized protein n=1 Tax=Dracunculus medinensis TaxID=318479 RepID=A0A0N4UJD5_DRAME|nr:unnamed protein product [Dracunculus medinensis]
MLQNHLDDFILHVRKGDSNQLDVIEEEEEESETTTTLTFGDNSKLTVQRVDDLKRLSTLTNDTLSSSVVEDG